MKTVLGASAALAIAVSLLVAQAPQADPSDPVLRAMVDELERSRALKVVDLEKPYYIEYSLEDADTFNVSASLGSLIVSRHTRNRVPQVQVRVGDYQFDNTNHVYAGYYAGTRYDPDTWPLENDYGLLRQCFWLATDRAYKSSVEAISRKRALLKNAATAETIPDFSKAPVVKILEPVKQPALDETAWNNRIVQLSDIYKAYPELHLSLVDVQIFRGTAYFVNSEGSVARYPDTLVQLTGSARAQAADGMPVHDLAVAARMETGQLPSDNELRRAFAQTAENIRALLKAPVGEAYSGPVLFEDVAAPQLLAQLIGDNLAAPRRPVSDPNRPIPFMPSDFETRVGSRVLPEWMDVVDDATQKEWRGRPLLGHSTLDLEGVPPKPVVAIEKGVLKEFITTRQPLKNFSGSTGSARLSGNFGARGAAISNLFVKASQTKPAAQLKAQLIDMVKQRNKPYGIIIRKLDYPTSAPVRELQTIMPGLMQGANGGRPVSPPVLVYRVYPDGREELVRGMRFRGLTARALRDIVAASDEQYVLDYVNNGAPFAVQGLGSYLAPTTVVAPALLFEDLEIDRAQDNLSKPPIVPPPPL